MGEAKRRSAYRAFLAAQAVAAEAEAARAALAAKRSAAAKKAAVTRAAKKAEAEKSRAADQNGWNPRRANIKKIVETIDAIQAAR